MCKETRIRHSQIIDWGGRESYTFCNITIHGFNSGSKILIVINCYSNHILTLVTIYTANSVNNSPLCQNFVSVMPTITDFRCRSGEKHATINFTTVKKLWEEYYI